MEFDNWAVVHILNLNMVHCFRKTRRQSLSEIGFGRIDTYTKLDKLGEVSLTRVQRVPQSLLNLPVCFLILVRAMRSLVRLRFVRQFLLQLFHVNGVFHNHCYIGYIVILTRRTSTYNCVLKAFHGYPPIGQ